MITAHRITITQADGTQASQDYEIEFFSAETVARICMAAKAAAVAGETVEMFTVQTCKMYTVDEFAIWCKEQGI